MRQALATIGNTPGQRHRVRDDDGFGRLFSLLRVFALPLSATGCFVGGALTAFAIPAEQMDDLVAGPLDLSSSSFPFTGAVEQGRKIDSVDAGRQRILLPTSLDPPPRQDQRARVRESLQRVFVRLETRGDDEASSGANLIPQGRDARGRGNQTLLQVVFSPSVGVPCVAARRRGCKLPPASGWARI